MEYAGATTKINDGTGTSDVDSVVCSNERRANADALTEILGELNTLLDQVEGTTRPVIG